MFHGRFTVDVEFLDLKIASINVNYVPLLCNIFFQKFELELDLGKVPAYQIIPG